MTKVPFLAERLACAYFFVMPALAYGILTSRLPALKAMIGADDRAIGITLLALGLSTLAGLLACNFLIERFNARSVTAWAAAFLAVNITIAGLATSYWQATLFCLIAGFGVGLCDVGMNAQGIFLERSRNILCLSFLHASSSIGGVAGSLSGSLFAHFNLAPFWNFVFVLGSYLLLWPLAFRSMPLDKAPTPDKGISLHLGRLPFFVVICGLLSLVCHIAEGSAAEWGSLLLNSVKGASQQEAALVFAAFTGAMVICRLCSDNLRRHVSDYFLATAGSLLGAAGMALVLLSPWPWLCLAGYALMGAGLAPVVPILFSRAGAHAAITPGKASAVVSVFSYAGLLLFPPFLGMLGKSVGLVNSLWIISILCLLMAFGSVALRKEAPGS